jgi:hypothetical protein
LARLTGDIEPEEALNFKQICHLEPELAELFDLASSKKSRENAEQVWSGRVQPQLQGLVGRNARNAALRSYEIFSLTIDTLRDTLFTKKLLRVRSCIKS